MSRRPAGTELSHHQPPQQRQKVEPSHGQSSTPSVNTAKSSESAAPSDFESGLDNLVDVTVTSLMESAVGAVIGVSPGALAATAIVVPAAKPLVKGVLSGLVSGIVDAVAQVMNNTSTDQPAHGSDAGSVSEMIGKARPDNEIPFYWRLYGNVKNMVVKDGPSSLEETIREDFVWNSLVMSSPGNTFSVLAYNILPEPMNPAEILVLNSIGQPEKFLVNKNYQKLLSVQLEAHSADIVCLQSVTSQQFTILQQEFLGKGYEGIRYARRGEVYGEACFFQTDRFLLIEQEGKYLDQLMDEQLVKAGVTRNFTLTQALSGNEVVQFARLYCRKSSQELLVVNTRLAPNCNGRKDLQCAQLCSILKAIKERSESERFVLAGQFDVADGDATDQVISEGAISMSSKELFDRQYGVGPMKQNAVLTYYARAFKHPVTTLKSTYETVTNVETRNSWNREEKKLVCGGDIYYGCNQISTVGVLRAPAADQSECCIPNAECPSSSWPLKAILQFT